MKPRLHPGWISGGLLCLTLTPGLGTDHLHAAEPSYYDCSYSQRMGAGSGVEGELPLVLRFMLNVGQQRAFRIDSPPARPVEMSLSAANDITLLDYGEGLELSLITIRNDGESVLSRHRLTGGGTEETGGAPLGTQHYGKCLPVRKTALWMPYHSGQAPSQVDWIDRT